MSDDKLAEFREDFPLFIEAGFVAVKQLSEIDSKRLFETAKLLNHDSVAPEIGLGYIALNKLEMKEATRIFEGVTQKEPENQLAKTFLGICYLLTPPKRKEGETIIHGAIANATDPTVVSLGKIALEWSTKDLSNKKSLFFPS